MERLSPTKLDKVLEIGFAMIDRAVDEVIDRHAVEYETEKLSRVNQFSGLEDSLGGIRSFLEQAYLINQRQMMADRLLIPRHMERELAASIRAQNERARMQNTFDYGFGAGLTGLGAGIGVRS